MNPERLAKLCEEITNMNPRLLDCEVKRVLVALSNWLTPVDGESVMYAGRLVELIAVLGNE